jgi:hypothetical protein
LTWWYACGRENASWTEKESLKKNNFCGLDPCPSRQKNKKMDSDFSFFLSRGPMLNHHWYSAEASKRKSGSLQSFPLAISMLASGCCSHAILRAIYSFLVMPILFFPLFSLLSSSFLLYLLSSLHFLHPIPPYTTTA